MEVNHHELIFHSESYILKNYYPNFLKFRTDDSYVFVNIDTSIVRAKTDYANKIATASGMSYIMMPSSKALTHKFI